MGVPDLPGGPIHFQQHLAEHPYFFAAREGGPYSIATRCIRNRLSGGWTRSQIDPTKRG